MKSFTLITIILVLICSTQANAQDKKQLADNEIVRLSPTAFPHLPKSIMRYLQARGCTVPQTFDNATPHNVIRGQFAKRGQFDWAVLCSRNRVSSILIFWNGSTRTVAEIAKTPDDDFLQTVNSNGKQGFSRFIGVVGKNFILEHYKRYGGTKPPPISHQGIEDGFVEKASMVHYFYRRRWLELQGSD
jgi:hypothetical protein